MSLIGRLADLLWIFDERRVVHELLTNPCFSLSSYRICHAVSTYQPAFSTILDIGANEGQFALAAFHRFPTATVYSFEPLPEVFQQLQRNTRKKDRIKGFNCALGNRNGKLDFYRNEYTQVSSALKISQFSNTPRCDPQKSSLVIVDSFRLEDLPVGLDVKTPALLKLDVQGMEKEVLAGGGTALKSIDFVVMEVAFSRTYDEQPLFDEMHEFMKGLGYRLVAPVGFNLGTNKRVIEADVLYLRA